MVKDEHKKKEKLQHTTLGISLWYNHRYKAYKNYNIILNTIQW